MSLKTMYPPQKDSPSTTLMGDILPEDTTLIVADASRLPTATPFPLTLGINKQLTETVLVMSVNVGNNELSVVRGFAGSAMTWIAGTVAARVFTAEDMQALQDNFEAVEEDIATAFSSLEDAIATASDGLLAAIGDEADERKTTDVASVEAEATHITITRTDGSVIEFDIPTVTEEADGAMTSGEHLLLHAINERVESLEQAGVWRGTFDTYADLPVSTEDSAWMAGVPLINDFVNVRDDETHEDGVARYIVSGINEYGDITYGFDVMLDYDVVGGSDWAGSGLNSTQVGDNAIASGNYSTALGYAAVATQWAIALGYNSTARGASAVALGANAIAGLTQRRWGGTQALSVGRQSQ
jgi:hypothetical protein